MKHKRMRKSVRACQSTGIVALRKKVRGHKNLKESKQENCLLTGFSLSDGRTLHVL